MLRIRPFRSGDEPALADVCLKTADAGADATGILDDDDLWAEIFLLPYIARYPTFAFVLETDDDRAIGYVVGTPDTDPFLEWFGAEWWPERGRRFARTGEGTRQGGLLSYADARRRGSEPFAHDYPAHLHIDLAPEAQGSGWGRRLIETFVGALRDAGVSGVHLVASTENTGALAFYPRVGFTALPSPAGAQAFGMRL